MAFSNTNIDISEQVSPLHTALRGSLYDIELDWSDIDSLVKASFNAAKSIHDAKAVGSTNPASDYGKELKYVVTLSRPDGEPLRRIERFYLVRVLPSSMPFRGAWLKKRLKENRKFIQALRTAQTYSPSHSTASFDLSPNIEAAVEEFVAITKDIEKHKEQDYPLFRHAMTERREHDDGTYLTRKILVLTKDFSAAIKEFAGDNHTGTDEEYWCRVLLQEVWRSIGEDPEGESVELEHTRGIRRFTTCMTSRLVNGYFVLEQQFGTLRINS